MAYFKFFIFIGTVALLFILLLVFGTAKEFLLEISPSNEQAIDVNYADLAAISLFVATLVMTAVAVLVPLVIGLAAFYGYQSIEQSAVSAAIKEASKILEAAKYTNATRQVPIEQELSNNQNKGENDGE